MKPVHYWIGALMLAFSLVNYFDRTILSVAAPGMMKEFDLTPTGMGVVFSAFQISYTALMTPGGRWSDRFGPRNMLAVVGIGAGLLTALMPLGAIPGLGIWIGVIPALVIVRLGFGAFTAPLYPATGRMNANWIPSGHRTRLQGLVNSGAGFGGAVSPILFSAMIARYGWRTSFVFAGAASIALGLVWFFTVRDRPFAVSPTQPEWGPLLRDRNMQWLIIGFAAVDYFEYIFFYWLFYYLGEVRKLSPDDTAFYTTIPFLAWVVMMPAGGLLTDLLIKRYGTKKGMRAVAMSCMTLSVLCLVAALRAPDGNTNTLVALLSLAFGFCAIADVVYWSAVISISGTQVGAACGLMNTGGNLGGGIAPVLTPMIASAYGWSAGLYFGAVIALIGLFAWLFINPQKTVPGTHSVQP
ncbi:MAG: MFS transporter [Acidobacteria bacterium]|nr:MFS transporter [Acidobacteriota bacterium]